MQEGRIVRAEDRCDARVARRADGVEALAARLQLARDPVELPAQNLCMEYADKSIATKAGAFERHRAGRSRQVAAGNAGKEVLVYDVGRGPWVQPGEMDGADRLAKGAVRG